MSDCPNGDIRDLLPDLLSGELGSAARAAVESHLRDCALCRAELDLLRGMRAALRRAPAVDVDAIVATIPPYRARVRQVHAHPWGGWRIAAAAALLVGGGASVVVARHAVDSSADGRRVATVRQFDSLPGSASVEVAVDPATSPSSVAPDGAAPSGPRELALAGGVIGDLDDRELSALIDDIGSIDAMPSAEAETPATLSPIAPTSPSGLNY
jgi:anti-sigma factor RsiW